MPIVWGVEKKDRKHERTRHCSGMGKFNFQTIMLRQRQSKCSKNFPAVIYHEIPNFKHANSSQS